LHHKVIVFEHFFLGIKIETLDYIVPLVRVGLVALLVVWEELSEVTLVYQFIVMKKRIVFDELV
jgi:hypothetical protein